jgi:hypothetical protein
VQDAQPKQDPPHVALFAGLDAIEEVLRALLAHALQVGQVPETQVIKIGDVADQSTLHQLRRQDLTAAFNVHRTPATPVFDPPAHLRRTIRIHAAPDGRVAFSRDALRHFRPAFRTFLREMENLLLSRPLRGDHADDFGNDLARLLDQHGIADADVEPFDLILVVQRRALDRRAGQQHGIQLSHRGQRAGATHLDGDGVEFRFGLFRRILVGHPPSRSFRGDADLMAERDRIQLDDGPIRFIGKLAA